MVLSTGTAEAATTAALWHMENPSVMTDSSGNGNNGTTTGITSVAGVSGKAYHFNGRNSVVTVPDSPSLNPANANLKIIARVRFTVVPSAAVGDYDLVRKGLAGTAGGEWKMEIFLPVPGCQSEDGQHPRHSQPRRRRLAHHQLREDRDGGQGHRRRCHAQHPGESGLD